MKKIILYLLLAVSTIAYTQGHRRALLMQNNASESYLLDTYGGANGAYSLRYLSSMFVGNDVVLVRRSSDNAELGFTPTEITDGTLTTWVGVGNNGFIKTIYDQMGSGEDLTQTDTSKQGKIVNAGALVLENGKPALLLDGSNDNYKVAFAVSVPDMSGVYVGKTATGDFVFDDNETVNVNSLWANSDSTLRLYRSSTPRSSIHTVTSGTLNSQFTTSFTSIKGEFLKLNVNGSSFTNAAEILPLADPTENTGITIGSAGSNALYQLGTFQEVVIYDYDQTANLTGINTNVNAYYTIY
jgi:hypothetical protein